MAPVAVARSRCAVTAGAFQSVRLQPNPALQHKDRKAEQKPVIPFEEADLGLKSQLRRAKANEAVQRLMDASSAFTDQDYFSCSPSQKPPASPPAHESGFSTCQEMTGERAPGAMASSASTPRLHTTPMAPHLRPVHGSVSVWIRSREFTSPNGGVKPPPLQAVALSRPSLVS